MKHFYGQLPWHSHEMPPTEIICQLLRFQNSNNAKSNFDLSATSRAVIG